MPSTSRTWRMWERPDDPPPFQLQDRDRQILYAIYRHRFLRPRHLHLMFGGSLENLKVRCRRLWQHRFLERPKAYRTTKPLTEELVYGLGKQGAHELDRLDSRLRLGHRDWTDEPKKQRGYLYLEHQLAVADFFVALAVACERRKHKLHWSGHTNRRVYRVRVPGEDEAFLADGHFILERGHDGNRALYFLELERGNKTLADMRAKLLRYYLWWKAEWRERANPPRGFRVLVIGEDPTYLESVRRVARDIGRTSAHPRAWGALLFADLSAVDLEGPERILDPVFRTADSETPVSLLG